MIDYDELLARLDSYRQSLFFPDAHLGTLLKEARDALGATVKLYNELRGRIDGLEK